MVSKGDQGGDQRVVEEGAASERDGSPDPSARITQLPGILWTTDRDLVFTSSQGLGLQALGSTPDQVVGSDLYSYFGTRDAGYPPIACHLGALAGEGSGYDFEWRDVWFTVAVEPLRDERGEIVGTIGLAVDITHRKRREELLREAQDRLATAQKLTRMGVWEWNVRTGEMFWTDETFPLLGLDPQTFEPSFERLLGLLHPDDRDRVAAAAERAIATDTPYASEARVLLPDGAVRHFHAEGRVLKDEAGHPERMLGIMLDITDRKQVETAREAVEAKLRHQQKLEAIGTLASGVAHEINNPIQGVLGYAELIEQLAPEGSPIRAYAREIVEASDRVAVIVRDLLEFSRRGDEVPSDARPSELVERTLSLIRTVLRHDRITLRVDVPGDLPVVRCRPHAIQQVLMNLITNARDALNERYPEHHPDKIAVISARVIERAGFPWLRLTVSDRGPGVEPGTEDRIFDPFFTTKEPALGTGLGLAVSHGIVTRHGGHLSVESEPGKGARFHVDLPLRSSEGATPSSR